VLSDGRKRGIGKNHRNIMDRARWESQKKKNSAEKKDQKGGELPQKRIMGLAARWNSVIVKEKTSAPS